MSRYSRLRLKDWLQASHIALLVISFLSGAILFIYSGEKDEVREVVFFIESLLVIIYPLGFILFWLFQREAVEGKSRFLGRLLQMYRRLLQRSFFLWLSNLLLTVAAVYCLGNLLFCRQVEFTTHHHGEVVVFDDVDNTSKDEELGTVTPDKPLKLRMRIGKHEIYYRSSEWDSARTLEVAPIYKTFHSNHFILDYDKDTLGR